MSDEITPEKPDSTAITKKSVKRGKIPGIKVGGQWRFKKEVLDEMFTQNAD